MSERIIQTIIIDSIDTTSMKIVTQSPIRFTALANVQPKNDMNGKERLVELSSRKVLLMGKSYFDYFCAFVHKGFSFLSI